MNFDEILKREQQKALGRLKSSDGDLDEKTNARLRSVAWMALGAGRENELTAEDRARKGEYAIAGAILELAAAVWAVRDSIVESKKDA